MNEFLGREYETSDEEDTATNDKVHDNNDKDDKDDEDDEDDDGDDDDYNSVWYLDESQSMDQTFNIN